MITGRLYSLLLLVAVVLGLWATVAIVDARDRWYVSSLNVAVAHSNYHELAITKLELARTTAALATLTAAYEAQTRALEDVNVINHRLRVGIEQDITQAVRSVATLCR